MDDLGFTLSFFKRGGEKTGLFREGSTDDHMMALALHHRRKAGRGAGPGLGALPWLCAVPCSPPAAWSGLMHVPDPAKSCQAGPGTRDAAHLKMVVFSLFSDRPQAILLSNGRKQILTY